MGGFIFHRYIQALAAPLAGNHNLIAALRAGSRSYRDILMRRHSCTLQTSFHCLPIVGQIAPMAVICILVDHTQARLSLFAFQNQSDGKRLMVYALSVR